MLKCYIAHEKLKALRDFLTAYSCLEWDRLASHISCPEGILYSYIDCMLPWGHLHVYPNLSGVAYL